jgi:hypothetical protein
LEIEGIVHPASLPGIAELIYRRFVFGPVAHYRCSY